MTKSTWQCLRISGYLEGKEDVELKFLLFQEGQNLGEITDIEYFKRNYIGRSMYPHQEWTEKEDLILGRSSEILRDEVKFSKFVGRLRKRFSNLFNDMLKLNYFLKNIITPEDWEIMSEHIQYDFLYDNHFAELKETELFNERLAFCYCRTICWKVLFSRLCKT